MRRIFSWNWRGVTSLTLLFSTIILFLSGIFLYISPSGRIAHITGWRVLGFDKEGWEAIHDLFGFFFIFLTLVHLWLNRRVIVGYLKDRARGVYRVRKELVAALLITGGVFLLAVFDVLPL